MTAIEYSKNSASVLMTEAEVIRLTNALNEVLHGIEMSEFRSRLGAKPKEAKSLLAEVALRIDEMK